MDNFNSKGLKHFVEFISSSTNCSIAIVDATIDEILSGNFFSQSNTAFRNIVAQDYLLGCGQDEGLDMTDLYIPVVKVFDSKWSIIYFSVFNLSDIPQERSISQTISSKLNTKVIYFCLEDTSLLMGYVVFNSGHRIGDEVSWTQLPSFDEAKLLLEREVEFLSAEDAGDILVYQEANSYLESEGVFIPACYAAENNSGQLWLATTQFSYPSIESVYMIPCEK